MPKLPKAIIEPRGVLPQKRLKVAMKLSLDPGLVEDVRARLRDGMSFSAHVARVLREDLDRLADAAPRRARQR